MIIKDKKICGGDPTIKGTRITVHNVIACLCDDMTIQEVCEMFSLNREQVDECILYAIECIK